MIVLATTGRREAGAAKGIRGLECHIPDSLNLHSSTNILAVATALETAVAATVGNITHPAIDFCCRTSPILRNTYWLLPDSA